MKIKWCWLHILSPDDLRRVAGVAVLIYTPVIASLGRPNLAGVMAAVCRDVPSVWH